MNIFPEEDLNMVGIQKVIHHLSDCLCTIKCAFQKRQDAKYKVTEKLTKEIKKLTTSVIDFTLSFFKMTFTLGKSKMLPQSFDYTPNRRKKKFFLISRSGVHYRPILFYFDLVFFFPLFSFILIVG